MPKKLLLPVLISLMFALPATAQEEGWQPEPGPSIPEMAMKVFRFVGGIVSSGNPVETDEMVLDQQSEKTAPPPRSTDRLDANPTSDVMVEEKLTGEPAQAEEPAPSVVTETVPVEGKTVPTQVKVPSEEQKEAVSVPEKQAVETSSEKTLVEKKKAGRSKKNHKTKPEKIDKNHQVAEQTETRKSYPEIIVSTYQDTLPSDISPAELQEKAQAGNPEAQYRLGLGCYNGEGRVQDNDKAFHWWQLSAEQGYPKAQHLMGVAYRKGIGTLKNAEKALNWFTKAAQQGRAIDQYIVADVYYEGKVNGIKDDGLAVYWATHAAEQGHPGALVLLAQAKLEGRGIQPNIIHAYALAKKAQEFDSNAEVVVEDIEKAMTEEQLKIAETLTLQDALKPISLTSLMVQKEMEAREGKPIQESLEKPTKTEESNEND